MAEYYYLPRNTDQKSVRTRRIEPGLIVDFAADGQAIGIEITSPDHLSLAAINAVLNELGQAPASEADLAATCGASVVSTLGEGAAAQGVAPCGEERNRSIEQT